MTRPEAWRKFVGMEDTWASLDLRVLVAAVTVYRRIGRQMVAEAITQEAGVDDDALQTALARLYRKGYFDPGTTLRGDDRYAVVGVPNDEALRVVDESQKPTPPATTRNIRGIGGNLGRTVQGP